MEMDTSRTEQPRSPAPGLSYDVRQMCEEDFEKLAVYMVADVQCDRGSVNRAKKTLPRSLTLRPSQVVADDKVMVIPRQLILLMW